MENKTLVNAIHGLERIEQDAQLRPDLEVFVRENAGIWPQLSERAHSFSQDLRDIGLSYLSQGKRKYKHKLENHWSLNKIEEFDEVLKTLGLYDNSNETLAALRESVLLVKNDQLQAVQDYVHSIVVGYIFGAFGGWLTSIPLYGITFGLFSMVIGVDGVDYPSTNAGLLPHTMVIGAGCGALLGRRWITGSMLKNGSLENPFENIANLIDKKLEYVSSRIGSYVS